MKATLCQIDIIHHVLQCSNFLSCLKLYNVFVAVLLFCVFANANVGRLKRTLYVALVSMLQRSIIIHLLHSCFLKRDPHEDLVR